MDHKPVPKAFGIWISWKNLENRSITIYKQPMSNNEY